MVTSLPSLSVSLYLSLSPKVPHAQYRKRFRASYNISALWCGFYSTVREISRSRYSHATTLQHLRARKLVRRTRSVHSRTRAPAKLVSTTMDFWAFVAKAPHLTIPRQRTLVYGGKLLFSNATAKIPKAISQKRHDGFSFLNDGNLDKFCEAMESWLITYAFACLFFKSGGPTDLDANFGSFMAFAFQAQPLHWCSSRRRPISFIKECCQVSLLWLNKRINTKNYWK